MNLTLYSLFTTYLSSSPMLMFASSYGRSSTLNLDKLSTHNFFNTFLYTRSNIITASITRSNFINYIQTPLVFNNDAVTTLTNSTDATFANQLVHKGASDAATIVVENCIFKNCQTSGNGGSIFFQNSGSLTVHGTFFKESSANNGGAIFAAKTEGEIGVEMKSEDSKYFHSHYCCYSSCSANNYGSATIIAATDVQLNYSSTLKCPGTKQAKGAQFDLKASGNTSFIASSNINSTTGNSEFCASLEYRSAHSGFFRFQTIVDHNGGFITSFTDLQTAVDISNCNIINVTVHGGLINNAPPGVIHVRHRGITISDFYIYGVNFSQLAAGKANLITCQNLQDLQITLSNSFVEISGEYMTGFNTDNVKTFDPKDQVQPTTKEITQLFLGDCQGEVKKSPPPIDYVEPDPTSEITSESTSEIIITSEPTSEIIITSEPTSEIIITSEPTSEIIVTSEPTIEQSSINETDPIPAPLERSGGSNKTPIIAGSVAAVAAVAIIAALAAFFIIRKKRLNFNNDVDLNETQDSSITTDNELRKMMSRDDPFGNEFENRVPTDL